MKTLKELNKLVNDYQDNNNEQAWKELEYSYPELTEDCEDNDNFVRMEIINPENNQHMIYAWIPEEYASLCQAEIDLTWTTQYHNWTSAITRSLKGMYNSHASALNDIRKFVNEYKKSNSYIEFNKSQVVIENNGNGKYWIECSGISASLAL